MCDACSKKEVSQKFVFETDKRMRPVGEKAGEMWCKMLDFDNGCVTNERIHVLYSSPHINL